MSTEASTSNAASPTPPLWTGALLRASREAQGLTLQRFSELTCIRRGLIEAIEQDDFKILPAPAYTRGLVIQIARELGLPEEEIAKIYMSRIL